MKQVRFLGMMAMMLCALAMGFASCSDGDDDIPGGGNAQTLVGTWEGVTITEWEKEDGEIIWSDEDEDYSDYRMKLNADGTFTEAEYDGGRWHWKTYESATWKFSGNTLTLKNTYSDGDTETVSAKVLKLTDSEMVVEAREKYKEDGTTWEYYSKITLRKIGE